MKQQYKIRIPTLFLMLLLIICMPSCTSTVKDGDVKYLFFDAIKNRNNSYQIHSLSDFIPVDWDQAYIFSSYVSKKKIYERVGYRWRGNIAEHMYESDYTMVFMLDDKGVYDVQGPREGVGFYSKETELELDKGAFVLVYPTAGGNPADASFVVVPPTIVSSIDSSGVELTDEKQIGKWNLDPAKTDFFGEMIFAEGEIVYIKVSLGLGYLVRIWGLNRGNGDISVIEHTKQTNRAMEDLSVKINTHNDDQMVMEISFVYEGEQIFYELPFLKVKSN